MTGNRPAPTIARLLTWLSPAFPVGAFAYSGGLESAIADARVTVASAMQNWLEGALLAGSARTDAILLAQAWKGQGDGKHLAELAELGLALIPSAERHAEARTMGAAFIEAARAWPSEVFSRLPDPCPYPVAVGAVAGAGGLALADTLTAFLTAWTQGQISVALRRIPLGQTDGLRLAAALEPVVAETAAFAAKATLEDLGTAGFAADIHAMRHETLTTRIFRS